MSPTPNTGDLAAAAVGGMLFFGAIGGGAALVFCGWTGRIFGAICFVPGAMILSGGFGVIVGVVLFTLGARTERARQCRAKIAKEFQ